MRKPYLSIIVPVYNVISYLERCIDSIVSQDLSFCEIILVNDGSTDNSGELAEELAEPHNNFRVIHQENTGLGGARNTGAKEAKGDYILFLDSDDELAPNALATIKAALQESSVDVLMFDYATIDEKGGFLERRCPLSVMPANPLVTTLEETPTLITFQPSAWARVCKTDLIRACPFPERIWFEDLATMPKITLLAESIQYINNVCLHYRKRPASITDQSKNKVLDRRNLEITIALESVLVFYKNHGAFSLYYEELEFLTLLHALVYIGQRSALEDHCGSLINELVAFTTTFFPHFSSNRHAANTLGTTTRLYLHLMRYRLFFLIQPLEKLFRQLRKCKPKSS